LKGIEEDVENVRGKGEKDCPHRKIQQNLQRSTNGWKALKLAFDRTGVLLSVFTVGGDSLGMAHCSPQAHSFIDDRHSGKAKALGESQGGNLIHSKSIA